MGARAPKTRIDCHQRSSAQFQRSNNWFSLTGSAPSTESSSLSNLFSLFLSISQLVKVEKKGKGRTGKEEDETGESSLGWVPLSRRLSLSLSLSRSESLSRTLCLSARQNREEERKKTEEEKNRERKKKKWEKRGVRSVGLNEGGVGLIYRKWGGFLNKLTWLLSLAFRYLQLWPQFSLIIKLTQNSY